MYFGWSYLNNAYNPLTNGFNPTYSGGGNIGTAFNMLGTTNPYGFDGLSAGAFPGASWLSNVNSYGNSYFNQLTGTTGQNTNNRYDWGSDTTTPNQTSGTTTTQNQGTTNPNQTSTQNQTTNSSSAPVDPMAVSTFKALLQQADSEFGDNNQLVDRSEWTNLQDHNDEVLYNLESQIDALGDNPQNTAQLNSLKQQLTQAQAYQQALAFINDKNFNILSGNGDAMTASVLEQMAGGQTKLSQSVLDVFAIKPDEHHLETLTQLGGVYTDVVGQTIDETVGFTYDQIKTFESKLKTTLNGIDITDEKYFLYKRALSAVTYLKDEQKFNKIAKINLLKDKDSSHITQEELTIAASLGTDDQNILSGKDVQKLDDYNKKSDLIYEYMPSVDSLKKVFEACKLDKISEDDIDAIDKTYDGTAQSNYEIMKKLVINKRLLDYISNEKNSENKGAAKFLLKYAHLIRGAYGDKYELEIKDIETCDKNNDGRIDLIDMQNVGKYSIFDDNRWCSYEDFSYINRGNFNSQKMFGEFGKDGKMTYEEVVQAATELQGRNITGSSATTQHNQQLANTDGNAHIAKFLADFYYIVSGLDGDNTSLSSDDIEQIFNISESGSDSSSAINIDTFIAKVLQSIDEKQTLEINKQ